VAQKDTKIPGPGFFEMHDFIEGIQNYGNLPGHQSSSIGPMKFMK
jgi:hypothetical protein